MTKRLKLSLSIGVFKSEYMKTLVVGIMILSGVLGFWFGSKAALRTEYPFLAVATPSMTPTMPVGTLIVVHGVPSGFEINAAYGNGDVIVFRPPTDLNDLWVHRAVEKIFNEEDGTWYIRTKGDYNPYPDIWSGEYAYGGFLSEKLVVGKVVAWLPWVGNVSLFLRTPTGMLVIVLLILLMIFIEYIPLSTRKEGGSKKGTGETKPSSSAWRDIPPQSPLFSQRF